jgi:hypothetical protein
MMPPEGRGGVPTPGNAHHHQQHQSISRDQYLKDRPPRRGSDLFREGFGRGWRDALRCAARCTNDPEVLAMLHQLANEYDLAGSDG